MRSPSGWKSVERTAAALFGLVRWPANSGYRVDFGGGGDHAWVGQVKSVRTMSLAAVEALALEMEQHAQRHGQIAGVVVVKRSARRPTPRLVVLTETEWLKIIHSEATAREFERIRAFQTERRG